MFSLFKTSIEERLFPLIWPKPNDTAVVMCETGGGLECPTAAVQATTAIANLAIASDHFSQRFPADRAHDTNEQIQRLIFTHIASDGFRYEVATILKLREEQEQWRKAIGMGAEALSNLDTIMRVVFRKRILQYREDMTKANLAARSGEFGEYGPMGYVAKRWLSQLSGRTILRENDLSEEGFAELGVASLYFTYKVKQLVAAINS